MPVGVVICAYTLDRWDLLRRAVASVESQDVEHELVLVIDHNTELLDLAINTWPHHSVISNRHGRGLSGARNTGVAASTCGIIAFLDDDAAADAGWLRALVAPFADERVGLTGGRVLPEWPIDPPTWFPDEFLWVVGCSYRGLPTADADIRNPIGASMAVRRRVFEEVGLFHDGVGRIGTLPLGCEETEFGIRARRAGYSTRYAFESSVRHHVSSDRHSFRYFVRRCWAEGRSKSTVSSLAGSADALESERAYLTHTIPSGIFRRLFRRGEPTSAPIRSSLALVAGCIITGVAYTKSRISRTVIRRREVVVVVPQLEPVGTSNLLAS